MSRESRALHVGHGILAIFQEFKQKLSDTPELLLFFFIFWIVIFNNRINLIGPNLLKNFFFLGKLIFLVDLSESVCFLSLLQVCLSYSSFLEIDTGKSLW